MVVKRLRCYDYEAELRQDDPGEGRESFLCDGKKSLTRRCNTYQGGF